MLSTRLIAIYLLQTVHCIYLVLNRSSFKSFKFHVDYDRHNTTQGIRIGDCLLYC